MECIRSADQEKFSEKINRRFYQSFKVSVVRCVRVNKACSGASCVLEVNNDK